MVLGPRRQPLRHLRPVADALAATGDEQIELLQRMVDSVKRVGGLMCDPRISSLSGRLVSRGAHGRLLRPCEGSVSLGEPPQSAIFRKEPVPTGVIPAYLLGDGIG